MDDPRLRELARARIRELETAPDSPLLNPVDPRHPRIKRKHARLVQRSCTPAIFVQDAVWRDDQSPSDV